MRIACVVVVALASACLEAPAVICESGRVCPGGTVCDEIAGTCVDPDQVSACEGKTEGESCSTDGTPGFCVNGTCFPEVCGDGIVEPGEACDDGNRSDGDGCRGDCRSDETCGNAIPDYHLGEECDCGSDPANLPVGCTEPNSDTSLCRTDCKRSCGDGVIGDGEVCDGAPPPEQSCLDYGFDRGALACSSFCAPAFAQCDLIGWQRVASTAFPLYGLWGTATDAFGVGDSGRIVHWDGNTMTEMTSNTTAHFRDVWGAAPNDVFAVGFTTVTTGAIVHYDGTTWTTMTTPAITNVTAIAGSSGQNVWAVGPTALARYDGTQWQTYPVPSGVTLSKAWPVSATEAYAVGFSVTPSVVGRLYRFNGTSWSEIQTLANHLFYAVWATSPTNIYVSGQFTGAGAGATLHHYNGTTWTQLGLLPGARFQNIVAFGQEVSAFDDAGRRGHWDGAVFTVSEVSESGGIEGASGTSATEMIAVAGRGGGSELFRYAGQDWSLLAEGGGTSLIARAANDIYALDPGGEEMVRWNGRAWQGVVNDIGEPTAFWVHDATDLLLSYKGTPPRITHCTPSGGSCVTSDHTVTQPQNAFWAPSRTEVFSVGDAGTIYRYQTSAWTAMTSPVTDNLVAVWGLSNANVYAIGEGGAIVHFDGTSWTSMTSGTTADLRAIWGAAANDVFVVGDGGTVLHFDGTSWSTMPTPTTLDLFAVSGSTEGGIYAVGDLELVLRFDGVAWTPVRSPETQNREPWRSVLSFANGILVSTGDESTWLRE